MSTPPGSSGSVQRGGQCRASKVAHQRRFDPDLARQLAAIEAELNAA